MNISISRDVLLRLLGAAAAAESSLLGHMMLQPSAMGLLGVKVSEKVHNAIADVAQAADFQDEEIRNAGIKITDELRPPPPAKPSPRTTAPGGEG